MASDDRYIPAMGHFRLARLYDPLIKLLLREDELKSELIRMARITESSDVLDVGCGTATLTLMIKRARPAARVVGLDGDERILEVARNKVAKSGMDIALDKAMSFDMPYPDGAFDRVVTCLVLHHMSAANQERTLKEVLRVLCPGGELHIADFEISHGRLGHLMTHLLGRFRKVAENRKGLLPDMMAQAGFVSVAQRGSFSTLLGKIGFTSGSKPK